MNRLLLAWACLTAGTAGCRREPEPLAVGAASANTGATENAAPQVAIDGSTGTRSPTSPLRDVISSGSDVCVVDADGAVFCRGYPRGCGRAYGQMNIVCPPGLGSAVRRWQPAFAIDGVSRVTVNDRATCVVGNRGQAQCADSDGRLGPVLPNVVDLIDDIRGYACTLDGDSRVHCFARDALFVPQDAGAASAIIVEGLGRPRSLSGWWRPCALDQSGWVACWGSVELGAAQGAKAVRVRAPVLFEELASGGQDVCARGKDGSIWCWQMDVDEGKFGSPRPIGGIRGAKGLAVGASHACALLGDGSVQCWGMAFFDCPVHPADQHLRAAQRRICPEPVRVPDLPAAQRTSAGTSHSCALTERGEVYCWGLVAGRSDDGGLLVKMDW